MKPNRKRDLETQAKLFRTSDPQTKGRPGRAMKMIVPLRSILHVRWDQMSALEQLIDARKIPFDWYMFGNTMLRRPKKHSDWKHCQLTKRQKLEIWIAYLERMPLKEICKRWNVNEATVYRIKYARVNRHQLYLGYDEHLRIRLWREASEERTRL